MNLGGNPRWVPLKYAVFCFVMTRQPGNVSLNISSDFKHWLGFEVDSIVDLRHIVKSHCFQHFTGVMHRVSYLAGGGGYSTNFYWGRLRPEVQPLTLLYTIFHEKGTPFVYVLLTNGAPFIYLV